MTYETILYTLTDNILTLTLNRPDKLNAANDKMLSELTEAFKQAERDANVRVVILTGAGRGFCPGQDLDSAKERQANNAMSYGDHLRHTYNPLITRMTNLPKPIIAAINGVAAGAGMSLALATDIRLAAESASFIQAFVKIGLVPDSGSSLMLQQLVGRTRAMEMMLTGKKVSAPEALAWGMVNQVVPDADLMKTANELAQNFAKAPTKAIGYIKRMADYAATHTLPEVLENEADMQEIAGRTVDHREGLSAFLEKRSANFKGE